MPNVVPPPLVRTLPQIEDWRQVGPSSFLGVDSSRAGQAIEVRVCASTESSRALQFAALSAGACAERLQPVVQSGLLTDGRAFLVLAHHTHGSLADRLPETMDELSALRLVETLAAALDGLHQARFAHLDLRPERVVFRGSGAVCLAPPGAAQVDRWAGPELQAGLPLDFQARVQLDVYGLASVLHACLLGQPPRPGRADAFRLEGAEVSRKTQQLLLRALAKDARRRFGSMRGLWTALRERLRDLGAELAEEQQPAGVDSPLGRCGPYQLLDEIARGGMGVVYRAFDPRLQSHVALKRMLFAPKSNEAERFLREARTLARLRHPGIVTVHEVDFDQGAPYMVMDLVSGGSLQARLREGPLDVEAALDIATRVAQAMHYAHGEGVVHRDLKPANVLLDAEGLPLVSDFGLALVHDGQSELTGSGALLGTLGYMPPEQAAGERDALGPWTDVYAIGAILYELVTGQRLFSAQSSLEMLRLIRERDPVPPQRLRPELPADVSAIILRCLEKTPTRRYPSAAALAADIERFRVGLPVEARPVGALERVWRRMRRHKLVSALSFTLVALALGFLVFHLLRIEAKNREIERRWGIAERRGEIAESTLVSLGEDVQGWLRFEQGDSRAQRVAERMLLVAIDGWEKLAEVAGEQDAISARAARARCNLGALLLAAHGERDRALALFQQAARELAEVQRRSPSLEVALDHARALSYLGNEQRHVDLAAARETQAQAVEVCREAEPFAGAERALWLTRLAGLLSSLAQTERELHGLSAALTLQQEALELAREAEACSPADLHVQQGLWRVLHRQADMLLRVGQSTPARVLSDEALSVARRLRKRQPWDLSEEVWLASSLLQVSKLAAYHGSWQQAYSAAAEASELCRGHLARASGNVGAQQNLVEALARLAACSDVQQERDAALLEARELTSALLRRFPDRPERRVQQARTVALLAGERVDSGGAWRISAWQEWTQALRALRAAQPASLGVRRSLAITLIKLAQQSTFLKGDLQAGMQVADEAWQLLTDVARVDSLNVVLRAELARCAGVRVELLINRGALNQAQAAAEQGLELALRNCRADSSALELHFAAASSATGLVFCLLRQGKSGAALDVANRAVAQLEPHLNAGLPAFWLSKLGRLYYAQAEATLEASSVESAYEIASRSVALLRQACVADSSSLDARFQLCCGLTRLSLAAESLARHDQALALRQEALALSSQAAQAHPEQVRWLLQWSGDLERLADSWRHLSEPEAERRCGQHALEVLSQLVAGDSNNIVWLQRLAVCAAHAGLTLFRQGAYEQAVAYLEQGVQVSEQICAQLPERLDLLELRARHRQNLLLGLRKRGDPAAALEAPQQALVASIEALLPHYPEDTIWLQIYAENSWDLADAAGQRGATERGSHLQAAVRASAKLLELCSDLPDHLVRLTVLQKELSEHRLRIGEPRAALESARGAVEALDALFALEPTNRMWQLGRERRRADLAAVWVACDDLQAAMEEHERSFENLAECFSEEEDQAWMFVMAYCEALRCETRLLLGEHTAVAQSVDATLAALQGIKERGDVGAEWWMAVARSFFISARLALLQGDQERARWCLGTAARLEPAFEGPSLWLTALTGSREPHEELSEVPSPEPLVRFLVGEIEADQLLVASAGALEGPLQQRALGIAHVYIGLKLDLAGELSAAQHHYQTALATGFCEPTARNWAKLRLAELEAEEP